MDFRILGREGEGAADGPQVGTSRGRVTPRPSAPCLSEAQPREGWSWAPLAPIIPGRRWGRGDGLLTGDIGPPLGSAHLAEQGEGRYLQHCCKGTRMESSSWEYFPNLQEGKQIVQGWPQEPCGQSLRPKQPQG